MKWQVGKIEIESEQAEVVAARLLDFGIEGVEIVDAYENARFVVNNPASWDYVEDGLLDAQKGAATVKFYLAEDAADKMRDISEALLEFGQARFALVEDDWSEAWRRHYKPFKVGENIVIVPEWEEYAQNGGELVFRIDPGHVFGTGQHQSTELCLVALEKHVRSGARLLDIGCGSGILSIVGLLLGAEAAVAVDIDPQAAKVCRENCRLNGIRAERLVVYTGNILDDAAVLGKVAQGRYDIIVANIIADVIIPLAPVVKGLLARGGVFIAGGIIKDRSQDVLAAMADAGFEMAEIAAKDEWVCLVGRL